MYQGLPCQFIPRHVTFRSLDLGCDYITLAKHTHVLVKLGEKKDGAKDVEGDLMLDLAVSCTHISEHPEHFCKSFLSQLFSAEEACQTVTDWVEQFVTMMAVHLCSASVKVGSSLLAAVAKHASSQEVIRPGFLGGGCQTGVGPVQRTQG